MAIKTIKCPICGRLVPFDDPNMPFCSDRCRMADLANWATDKYVIPGGTVEPVDESDDSPESR